MQFRGLRDGIGDLKKLVNIIMDTVFLSEKDDHLIVVDDQMPNGVFYNREWKYRAGDIIGFRVSLEEISSLDAFEASRREFT